MATLYANLAAAQVAAEASSLVKYTGVNTDYGYLVVNGVNKAILDFLPPPYDGNNPFRPSLTTLSAAEMPYYDTGTSTAMVQSDAKLWGVTEAGESYGVSWYDDVLDAWVKVSEDIQVDQTYNPAGTGATSNVAVAEGIQAAIDALIDTSGPYADDEAARIGGVAIGEYYVQSPDLVIKERAQPAPYVCTLAVDGSGLAYIRITTSDGLAYAIDWGDGNTTDPASSGTQHYHTYTSYTGNATITFADDQRPLGVKLSSVFSGNLDTELASLNRYDSFVNSFDLDYTNHTGTTAGIGASLSGLTGSITTIGDSSVISGNAQDLTALCSGLTGAISLNGHGHTIGGDYALMVQNVPSITGNVFLRGNLMTGELNVAELTSYNAGLTGSLYCNCPLVLAYGDIAEMAQNATGLTGDLLFIGATHRLIGDVAVAGSYLTNLATSFYFDGANMVLTGDMAAAITSMTSLTGTLRVNGALMETTVDSVPTFNTTMNTIYYHPKVASSIELDRILEGAAAITTWTGSKTVLLNHARNGIPGVASTGGGGWIDQILANGATSVLVNS